MIFFIFKSFIYLSVLVNLKKLIFFLILVFRIFRLLLFILMYVTDLTFPTDVIYILTVKFLLFLENWFSPLYSYFTKCWWKSVETEIETFLTLTEITTLIFDTNMWFPRNPSIRIRHIRQNVSVRTFILNINPFRTEILFRLSSEKICFTSPILALKI